VLVLYTRKPAWYHPSYFFPSRASHQER